MSFAPEWGGEGKARKSRRTRGLRPISWLVRSRLTKAMIGR